MKGFDQTITCEESSQKKCLKNKPQFVENLINDISIQISLFDNIP